VAVLAALAHENSYLRLNANTTIFVIDLAASPSGIDADEIHAAGHGASVCRLPWPGNAGQLRTVVVGEFACDNARCSSAS
jgi:hypothetical protein